jgi:glycosyltransferase involved in cell wall biosynthesis
LMRAPLTIFVPHCSDLLTDHLPHGDGLTAHGFITNLAKRGHILHVAAQKVDLREPLPPNVTLYTIPLKTTGKITLRLEYMARVRSLLNKLKKDIHFDLVHQLNPVFTGMSLALAGCQLPLVLGTYVAQWPNDPDALTAHGGFAGRLANYGRDVISALQQRQADALLLTTPAAWNRLPDPDRVGNRVHFLPHGLDTTLFSPAENNSAGISAQPAISNPKILFFANILKRKGIFTLLEAFASVAPAFPGVTLQIAGDGPALPEVKARVAALDCANQIEFLGRQERQNAPTLYRNCTIFCLPSLGEPYGGTVQEAMSCGKPLVVTNSGGPPHLVPEDGGLRVPAGDAPALAQALILLLNSPQLCEKMGRRNRQVAVSTMSWQRVAEQLEAIYEVTLLRYRGKGIRQTGMAGKGFAVSTEKAVQERV